MRHSRGVAETKSRQSRDESEARSVLRALLRVSQCPEFCALAHILFYVTVVRIRVFMRTLESNLVLIVVSTLYSSVTEYTTLLYSQL